MASDATESSAEQSNADLSDVELQRDMLLGRGFSLAEAIGREGATFMKGESPVPPLMQAIAAVNQFIDQHLHDSPGALEATLKLWARADSRIGQQLNTPITALQEMMEAIVQTPDLLYEFVRQVDVKWGQLYDERPHFQQPGQPPHPDDEYTHESVRETLLQLLECI